MRPLVLLHGFAGGPASWDAVAATLPTGVAVYRPTLLGHGVLAAAVQSFEAEVARVAAEVRRAGAERCHLAGYSLGARIALGLLVLHPGVAASATLIGVNPGLAEPAERRERRESDESWARLLDGHGLAAFLAAWEAQPLFATQRRLPESVRGAQRAARSHLDPAGLALAMRALGLGAMPDLWPALADVAVEVTLVVGEEDEKLLAIGERAVRHLRLGRLQVVPGAGHNVVLEKPREVAAILGEGAAS